MNLRDRLYCSTIGEDAMEMAKHYGLGLEMAEFCTAENLDDKRDVWQPICRERMQDASRFVFHAPFNEMCTCAVDPLVRHVTLYRFRQAAEMAASLGIRRMVYHSTHVPLLYFDCFFVEQSIGFWKEFLETQPQNLQIYLENVVDVSPKPLLDVLEGVHDPRLRICLDVGHAHVSSEIPVEEWVQALAPFLGHIHVHDNCGDHDWHLPLGEGNIDWEHLFPLIESVAPGCTYTVENMVCHGTVQWLLDHHFLEEESV